MDINDRPSDCPVKNRDKFVKSPFRTVLKNKGSFRDAADVLVFGYTAHFSWQLLVVDYVVDYVALF